MTGEDAASGRRRCQWAPQDKVFIEYHPSDFERVEQQHRAKKQLVQAAGYRAMRLALPHVAMGMAEDQLADPACVLLRGCSTLSWEDREERLGRSR